MTVNPDEAAAVIAAIEKEYGEKNIHKGSESQKVSRIPFPSYELNMACGGGIPLGRFTRIWGNYCLGPETPVLKSNFTWVPIREIIPGDKLVGFDEEVEESGQGKQRKLKESTVISNPLINLPSYRIKTSKGTTTIASEDHKWLCVSRFNGLLDWKNSSDLEEGDKIIWFGRPWDTFKSLDLSYLAGIFDGEGWWNKSDCKLGFAQNPGPVLDKCLSILDKYNFKYKIRDVSGNNCKRVDFPRRTSHTMRMLCLIDTERLAKENWWENKSISSKGNSENAGSSYAVVESIEFVGNRNLYAIETSTETLIADGMCSHNSSGKTLNCLNLIANAQRLNLYAEEMLTSRYDLVKREGEAILEKFPNGLEVAYYNVEGAYTKDFAEMQGVDTDRLYVIEGGVIEDMAKKTESLLGSIHLHIIDSVSAAASVDELSSKITDWHRGIKARVWGKVLDHWKEHFDLQENAIVLIDQARTNQNTGMDMAPGGNKVEHASDLTINFNRGKWLFDRDGTMKPEAPKTPGTLSGKAEADGIEIVGRVTKSRVGRPLRTARLQLGLNSIKFDTDYELAKIASYLNVVEQAASWYTLPSGDKVQGERGLKDAFDKDIELKSQVIDKARLYMLENP